MANQVVMQAKSSPGIQLVKLSNRWFRDFYTLTHWHSKEAMQRFMTQDKHKEAMRNWMDFATEISSYGYETEHPPRWAEARRIIERKGRTLSPTGS